MQEVNSGQTSSQSRPAQDDGRTGGGAPAAGPRVQVGGPLTNPTPDQTSNRGTPTPMQTSTGPGGRPSPDQPQLTQQGQGSLIEGVDLVGQPGVDPAIEQSTPPPIQPGGGRRDE